jgi:hypothetical protein
VQQGLGGGVMTTVRWLGECAVALAACSSALASTIEGGEEANGEGETS